MASRLKSAEAVAELYGVDRTTVWRWYRRCLFDVPPTVVDSPTGTRDRILFDSEAVAKQFAREMLRGLDPGPVRDERMARLRNFRKA